MSMSKELQYIVNIEDKYCTLDFLHKFEQLVGSVNKKYEEITFICIGTDRSTGDCFGPLVGYMLSRYTRDYNVYGTLKDPVHAKNLDSVLMKVNIEKELIIAVDASLGSGEHIGNIVLSNSPIKPGSGVGKDCTPVGDLSISGIVNIAGFAPALLLQCTRLYSVHKMAEIVNLGISSYFFRHKQEKV